MRRALIVFARMPKAGSVKTRLMTVMTAEEAAALYRCMLHDTLAKTLLLNDEVSVTVFYEEGKGAKAYFAEAAQGRQFLPQRGKELGERMENAFREMFGGGNEAVVIVGTDIPHLPSRYIEDAFILLEQRETDVVFGPANDGGYYLLGMKRLHPQLFRDIAWSTDTVLKESVRKGNEAGLHVAMLPEGSDVDTADDLLRPELLDEGNEAPLTRKFLNAFFARQSKEEKSAVLPP